MVQDEIKKSIPIRSMLREEMVIFFKREILIKQAYGQLTFTPLHCPFEPQQALINQDGYHPAEAHAPALADHQLNEHSQNVPPPPQQLGSALFGQL